MKRGWLAYGAALSLLLVLAEGRAADPQQSQKRELEGLRREIQQYEKELSQHKRNEMSAVNLLAQLDKEITISAKYLRSLNKEIAGLEGQVQMRDAAIRQLQVEHGKFLELIKKRIVSFYKYRRTREIDLLLTADSWKKVRTWLKYQRMIADNDRRNLTALVQRQQQLQEQFSYLRAEMAEKERKLQERQTEERQLRQSREKRTAYLTDLRKDKKVLEQRLRESKEAEKKIIGLIAQAEQVRLTRKVRRSEKQPVTAGKFAACKGRLMWPVKGSIVSRFGRQRHPELNTITENLGIDIKAKPGTPVYAVGDGQVQTITWQRGCGSIVIISHDDGYYTVYTHLEDILVEENQTVRQGESIGAVGETGSVNGSVLHFQIWKNTTNLDPEEWLG
jgi:murein hydrolase activator